MEKVDGRKQFGLFLKPHTKKTHPQMKGANVPRVFELPSYKMQKKKNAIKKSTTKNVG
jgi:hypothetical protein